jgi:hypothetical protein
VEKALISAIFIKRPQANLQSMPSVKKPTTHRHLMGYAPQGSLGQILGYAGDLKQHSAGLHTGYPSVRLTLALTHASFQGLGGDGFVREDTHIDPAFTVQKMRGGNTASFYLLSGYPTKTQ